MGETPKYATSFMELGQTVLSAVCPQTGAAIVCRSGFQCDMSIVVIRLVNFMGRAASCACALALKALGLCTYMLNMGTGSQVRLPKELQR